MFRVVLPAGLSVCWSRVLMRPSVYQTGGSQRNVTLFSEFSGSGLSRAWQLSCIRSDEPSGNGLSGSQKGPGTRRAWGAGNLANARAMMPFRDPRDRAQRIYRNSMATDSCELLSSIPQRGPLASFYSVRGCSCLQGPATITAYPSLAPQKSPPSSYIQRCAALL